MENNLISKGGYTMENKQCEGCSIEWCKIKHLNILKSKCPCIICIVKPICEFICVNRAELSSELMQSHLGNYP